MKSILICEDDKAIQNLFKLSFRDIYTLHIVSTAEECLNFCIKNIVDVLILDLGLPDRDGLEVIKEIRSYCETIPILVVSARMDDDSKIQALDAGANDFIVKPFSTEELKARIRNVLRYFSQVSEKEEPIFRNGSLAIDFASHTVTLNGEEIKLTNYEYKILVLLAQNIGKTLTHNYIISKIWGAGGNDANTLRVFVSGIRRKIEKNPLSQEFIRTDVGVGYRMNRCD